MLCEASGIQKSKMADPQTGNTVSRHLVYRLFVHDTSSIDISSTDISSTVRVRGRVRVRVRVRG